MEQYVSEEQIKKEFYEKLQRKYSLDEIDAMNPTGIELLYGYFSDGYLRGCRYSVEITKNLINKAKQDVQNDST